MNRLSQGGRDWLKLAVDPYHDNEVMISGFPDASTGRSVVQCYRRQTTINFPSDSDCHVFMTPVNSFLGTLTPQTCSNTNDLSAALANVATTGLVVCSGAVGSSLPSATSTFQNLDYAISNSSAVQSPSRVVACGFEVTNTTPDIDAGGSVTVYRSAASPYDDTYAIALQNFSTLGATSIADIPSTASEVQSQNSSKQWSAKEGCYVVVPLAHTANPYSAFANKALVMRTAGAGATNTVYSNVDVVTGKAAQAHLTPMYTCGAYFQGLPAGSSLMITARWYVESQPTPADPFLQLATPPASYDPRALQLYSDVLSHLPVGCPKGDNDAGDWWKKALNIISKVAGAVSTVAGFIPGVGAVVSPIAGAVSVGAKLASDRIHPAQVPRPQRSPGNAGNSRPPGRFVASATKPKKKPLARRK